MVRAVAVDVSSEYSHSAVRYYYITNEPLDSVFTLVVPHEQIPGDTKVRAWQAIILLARVPVP